MEPTKYRGFIISEPTLLTTGIYRVYVTRYDGSLVVTGENTTPESAIVFAKENLDYFLDEA